MQPVVQPCSSRLALSAAKASLAWHCKHLDIDVLCTGQHLAAAEESAPPGTLDIADAQ